MKQGSKKKMDTNFRFAILRLVISVAHMRCIKLENPLKVPPDSIKNTDPGNVRQRTVKIIRTLSI